MAKIARQVRPQRPTRYRHVLATALTCAMVGPFTACCGLEPAQPDAGVHDAGDADGGDGAPTWASISTEVIAAQGCAVPQCHGAGNQGGIVVLDEPGAYDRLVGQPSAQLAGMILVEPGAPEQSYFFRKLEGTQGTACSEVGQDPLTCGVQMPKNRPPLDAATLERTRRWIEDGAPR